MKIDMERPSLKGKRKQRFFFYLFSYEYKYLKEVSAKLNMSASELISYLIENKLEEVEI